MNFIKKLFDGKIDESVHRQFTRFGKGVYGGRAGISLWKTKKVKVKGGFEYANDFVLICSDLTEMKFSGVIISKESVDELKQFDEKKKAGVYYYEVAEINNSLIKEISKKVYYMLLNGEGEGIKLKIKKKLPKPGKSEEKIDNKFCSLEADEKYFNKIKEDLFWDVPDCKKAEIKHEYNITEIVAPEDEDDFAKVRELAKRKGTVKRIIEFDGQQKVNDVEFLV